MVFGSSILEIAIGLALVYTLFAVVCSALNEWLAGILKLRATTLREGIQNLLNDPNAETLAKDFFAHPLFKGLTPGNRQAFPSYIPPRTFARILIDIVSPAGAERPSLAELYKKLRAVVVNLSARNDNLGKAILILMDEAGADPDKLDQTIKSLEQLETTRQALMALVGGSSGEITQIQAVASTLEKISGLETMLKRAEEEATATLYKAQANVEAYFDESMERLSGWYKRRVQVFIIGFAVVVSLLLNVDTLAIAKSLVNDPALRQSLVAVAENTTPPPNTNGEPLATVNETLDQINQLGVPIGWQGAPRTTTDWGLKIFGLLISIVAISQGSPFWFDLLGKLVNVRMAGKKPSTPGDKTNEPTTK